MYVTNEMRTERLTQLRRVVEAAPEEEFLMSIFQRNGPCGTARCAAGWAATDPWFNLMGLTLRMVGDRWMVAIPSGEVGGDALEEFFGLDERDSDTLFAMMADYGGKVAVTRQEVIDNIDRILTGLDPIPYRALAE